MVYLLAAQWVQLSVSVGNGWPHNALRHHWLMPINYHFRDCKALLVSSLTHVSGTITSVQTFTFSLWCVAVILWSDEFFFNYSFWTKVINYNQQPTNQLQLIYCTNWRQSTQTHTNVHQYIYSVKTGPLQLIWPLHQFTTFINYFWYSRDLIQFSVDYDKF